MVAKIAILFSALASLALAAPQQHPWSSQRQYDAPTYEATGVLEPEAPTDLGEYDRIVAATLDVLPEISDALRRMTSDRERSNDPERVQALMTDLIPLTRKVMLATEKAGGNSFSDDDYRRINAAVKVMPSVVEFMNTMQEINLFGTSTQTPVYA